MKIILAIALILLPTLSFAQTRPQLTGRPIEDIRSAVEGKKAEAAAPDLIGKIQQVALDDLKAATADAKATGDTIASNCYDAWIGLITAQQTAQGAALPEPHIITAFQRNRDLVNALRPGSPLKVACAPFAEELKQDVITLLSKIAGGALTLPALLAPFGL